jgi:hypothetical protein
LQGKQQSPAVARNEALLLIDGTGEGEAHERRKKTTKTTTTTRMLRVLLGLAS